MGHAKHASKQEYNKPRLKEQIDAAMQAFLKAGHAVERLPSIAGQDAAVVQPEVPAAPEEEA